jgi:ligand-binding sensor domain-containing protein
LGYSKEGEFLHVRSVLEDSKGRLWIGNNGIGVLLNESDGIIKFSKKLNVYDDNIVGNTKKSPSGTLNHIFVITETENGDIWFGDRDTGAWKYNGKSLVNFTVDEDLKGQMIWDIYEDKNNNLLFAMANGGVYKFNGESFDQIF